MSLGSLTALLVFVIALFVAIGVIAAAHLLWWCIAGLALAILLGGVAVPLPVIRGR